MLRACSIGSTSFTELPAHQRHLDQPPAEGDAVAGDEHRLRHRAAHQPRRAHAVRQAGGVDHVGHLPEAGLRIADQEGGGALQPHLAARPCDRVPSLSFSRTIR